MIAVADHHHRYPERTATTVIMPPPTSIRRSCNFRDGRHFVVIIRVDSLCPTEDVVHWALARLATSQHTAAYDTYGRTKSAWYVMSTRDDGDEVRLLIQLEWNGRRHMDMDALIYSEQEMRPPPVMNAAEILELLVPKGSTSESTFGGLEAVGTSCVTKKILEEIWDEALEEEKNEADGFRRYRLKLNGSNAASRWEEQRSSRRQ